MSKREIVIGILLTPLFGAFIIGCMGLAEGVYTWWTEALFLVGIIGLGVVASQIERSER